MGEGGGESLLFLRIVLCYMTMCVFIMYCVTF